MWPMEHMMIITASPLVVAHPITVSGPCDFSFSIAVPIAANMRKNVPINSAPTWFNVESTQQHQFMHIILLDKELNLV
ncbi:hypothetical protein AAZV13_14G102200 [Glycine max]